VLSQKRADNLMQFIISQGVRPSLVSEQGFGDADPVASNDTAIRSVRPLQCTHTAHTKATPELILIRKRKFLLEFQGFLGEPSGTRTRDPLIKSQKHPGSKVHKSARKAHFIGLFHDRLAGWRPRITARAE
jgi:hypothetical protein